MLEKFISVIIYYRKGLRLMKKRKDWVMTFAIGAAGKSLVDFTSLLPEPYGIVARLVLVALATILIVKY